MKYYKRNIAGLIKQAAGQFWVLFLTGICQFGKSLKVYFSDIGLVNYLIGNKSKTSLRPCKLKLTKTPNSGMVNSIERFRSLSRGKRVPILEGSVISLVDKSFPLSRDARHII